MVAGQSVGGWDESITKLARDWSQADESRVSYLSVNTGASTKNGNVAYFEIAVASAVPLRSWKQLTNRRSFYTLV